MPLILAIEPARRQAAQLSVVVRKRGLAEQIASYLERAAQERPSPVMAGISVTNVADVEDLAMRELEAADPQPTYQSPSLNYESPSLRAIAAVEHPTVTIEEAVTGEWLD